MPVIMRQRGRCYVSRLDLWITTSAGLFPLNSQSRPGDTQTFWQTVGKKCGIIARLAKQSCIETPNCDAHSEPVKHSPAPKLVRMEDGMSERNAMVLELVADIVAAYVTKNSVPPSDLPALIASVHASVSKLGAAVEAPKEEVLVPAIPIRKSVTRDAIICLEDGQGFKSLKRHLNSKHGMTPEQYRTKWNLPADYPMVAPAYAENRSNLAKAIGLGRTADSARAKAKRASPA